MFTAEERRKYIGGSDIATVLGMSRWNTPLKLWLEKIGEAEPTDLSTNEAVQLGTELEDFVAKKFAKATGKQVRKQSKMYVHKDYPFMVAHVDRLITRTNELLECKTCSAFKKEEAYRRAYSSERDFEQSVERYVRFFNEERPHQTLNYLTPCCFEQAYYQKKS